MVPIFSTAYTLSGMLVSYQMNTIFYDAMFMLPLLIVALEEVLEGSKPYKYMFLLAAAMFHQFYLGYMVSIFIALYACYYMAPNLAIEGKLEREAQELCTASSTGPLFFHFRNRASFAVLRLCGHQPHAK